MAHTVYIQGLKEVEVELNRRFQQAEEGSLQGLIAVAANIRRETELVAPATPLDLGNLRASWFSVHAKGPASDPLGKSGRFREGNKKSPRPPGIGARLKAEHTAAKEEYRGEANADKPKISLFMGYSANYAAPVHEIALRHPNVEWSPRSPEAGFKWFEAALKRNKNNILKTVADATQYEWHKK